MANGPPSEPPLIQTSGHATDCGGAALFDSARGGTSPCRGPALGTQYENHWSTRTCERYWTFSDLTSQSNQLVTNHQHRWRQCDDVGNYDEQGDAKGTLMHSPFVASAYNFISFQTCERCVQLFLKSWDRVRAVHLSCQHALLQIVWKQQLHRHAINESKLQNTPLTDFTVKLFVCVKLILVGHVSGITSNVFHIRIGWNKSSCKTYRP